MTEVKTLFIGDAVQAGVAEQGEICFLDVKELRAGDIVRLAFRAQALGVFLLRLLRAGALAHQTRSKHRLALGQDPDPEPPVSLPLEGAQVRPHTGAHGVLLQLHVADGVSMPLHLTVEQSRHIAAALLRQAEALEATPGIQAH